MNIKSVTLANTLTSHIIQYVFFFLLNIMHVVRHIMHVVKYEPDVFVFVQQRQKI